MFTIVFKYLLFFNFNNKRVRRTFSGGYIVFVGMPHPSCAMTLHSSSTGPSSSVGKPHHDWICRNGLSSSANSEIFAKGNDIKLSTSPYIQNFIQGFKMSTLLSISFKSLMCFSEATSLSFLICQLKVRVHVFLDQFHPWPTICVCLCKGVIQQEWCKLTTMKTGLSSLFPRGERKGWKHYVRSGKPFQNITALCRTEVLTAHNFTGSGSYTSVSECLSCKEV